MKKIIITLISAVITCIAVDAQDNLRGNWSNIQSVMGTTINEILTFDSELSGNVYNKVSINLSANMMGVKLDGEMEMSVTGTFEYKEDKLIIQWNTESIQQKTIKPVKCYQKGEPVPEMEAEMEKVMTTVLEEIKKTALKEEIYESVSFKKGKLTLVGKDAKGKKHSETYNFVK